MRISKAFLLVLCILVVITSVNAQTKEFRSHSLGNGSVNILWEGAVLGPNNDWGYIGHDSSNQDRRWLMNYSYVCEEINLAADLEIKLTFTNFLQFYTGSPPNNNGLSIFPINRSYAAGTTTWNEWNFGGLNNSDFNGSWDLVTNITFDDIPQTNVNFTGFYNITINQTYFKKMCNGDVGDYDRGWVLINTRGESCGAVSDCEYAVNSSNSSNVGGRPTLFVTEFEAGPVISFVYPTFNQFFSNDYDGWFNTTTNVDSNCSLNRTDWVFDAGESDQRNKSFFNAAFATLPEGANSINISCWNANNLNTSEILTFNIDQTQPDINIVDGNGFTALNQSIIDQYNSNLFPLNISYSDSLSLASHFINFTLNGTSFFALSNTTVTDNNVSFVKIIDSSNFTEGIYNIALSATDTPTTATNINFSWYKGNHSTSAETLVLTASTQSFNLFVTKQSGYIKNIDAKFSYNDTIRSSSKASTAVLDTFTSSFAIPGVPQVYDFFWEVNITQDDDTFYLFNVSGTQEAVNSIVNITFLDEQNQSLINETLTVFITLEQTRTFTATNGFLSISNLTFGEHFITAENTNYIRRGIFFTPANASNSLTMYLLKDVVGNDFTTFFVTQPNQAPIEDVRMTFQKSINGSFVTVAQQETDFAGQSQLFLEIQNEYRIVMTHDSFGTQIISLRPLVSEYTIIFEAPRESLYDNIWEGLRYTMTPRDRVLNVTPTPTEVSLDIFADDSSLEFFGVFIDGTTLVCIPASCLVNITGSPAGGKATLLIFGNETGQFDVHYFFKRSGFDVQFIHGSLYGFRIFAALIGPELTQWLDTLTDNLGGKDGSRLMRAFMAAILVTLICVVASQMGVVGVPLVLVATLGNLFFILAGFIDIFFGIIIVVVGLASYIVLARDE